MMQMPLLTPKASRYGWPYHSRIEEFEKQRDSQSLPTHRITFQGKAQDFPIVRIPINLPKYRLANGRTTSCQQEYLAKNKALKEDFFDNDPELLDVQEVQHKLLQGLVKAAGLLDYFKDPANQQVDPIILDEFGFVINGNRRLTTWRDLYADDPHKFGHFSHIDVVVLPHCDEKELDKLEATLQVQPDIKAGYSWDTEANMMLQKQQHHGFTTKELAELYVMKESEVKELLDMRNYAAEYLRSRGKENYWSLVSENEFAFRKIVQCRSKMPSLGEKELFKEAAFVLIDRPDSVPGRLYEAIPNIGEYLGTIKDKLADYITIEETDNAPELDDLFGSSSTDVESTYIKLAVEISKPEVGEKVRAVISDVIETQKELKKDAKTEQYLLTMISKANSALSAAVSTGLRPESNAKGVEHQLASLEEHIKNIRRWLSEHD